MDDAKQIIDEFVERAVGLNVLIMNSKARMIIIRNMDTNMKTDRWYIIFRFGLGDVKMQRRGANFINKPLEHSCPQVS